MSRRSGSVGALGGNPQGAPALFLGLGRIGAQGQTSAKSFADEEAAARHADKQIQEKTDKGYQKVT
jgi:predicted DNA-binding WGR domain protein